MLGEHEFETLSLSKEDLEALSDLLSVYRMLMDMMTDQLVSEFSKIASTLFKLLDGIVSTDLVDVLERALQDPQLDRALMDPPKVGLSGLLGAMRDEDFQRGLGLMVELLKALGRASKDVSSFKRE
ncbi:MAG TPA: DUF1641 domain-containing protein [Candidatus Korarchaeota archaeon]|nr:DUF1641 domain-containing protein [Candidatus Korarchaeota archaeon]